MVKILQRSLDPKTAVTDNSLNVRIVENKPSYNRWRNVRMSFIHVLTLSQCLPVKIPFFLSQNTKIVIFPYLIKLTLFSQVMLSKQPFLSNSI